MVLVRKLLSRRITGAAKSPNTQEMYFDAAAIIRYFTESCLTSDQVGLAMEDYFYFFKRG